MNIKKKLSLAESARLTPVRKVASMWVRSDLFSEVTLTEMQLNKFVSQILASQPAQIAVLGHAHEFDGYIASFCCCKELFLIFEADGDSLVNLNDTFRYWCEEGVVHVMISFYYDCHQR